MENHSWASVVKAGCVGVLLLDTAVGPMVMKNRGQRKEDADNLLKTHKGKEVKDIKARKLSSHWPGGATE